MGVLLFIFSSLYLPVKVESFRKRILGIDDLEEREERFLKNPMIGDGLYLIDRYACVLKDGHKAIKYAEQCLTLERQPECRDWLINFWLADLYNRTGDIDKSRSRLTAALKPDIGNRIENGGWIERYELQAIYEQIP